jgi:drug/metabolite transporter (DMT)-like permease
MGIGSVVLLSTGISTGGLPPLSLQSWAIIGWLALVNTAIAFTLWNRTLQTLQATESSVINGTMMIWIPILAVLFLGETLDLKGILGLIIAGVGTLLVQLRQNRIQDY